MNSAIEILQYHLRKSMLKNVDMYMGFKGIYNADGSLIVWYNFKQENHRFLGPAAIYQWYDSLIDEIMERRVYTGHYRIKDKYFVGFYYTPCGKLITEYWSDGSLLHRNKKPAVIEYRNFGEMNKQVWYHHGKIFRTIDYPRSITYNAYGQY